MYLLSNLDHFIPRRIGGTSDEENLLPSCFVCNMLKSGNVYQTVEAARQAIMSRRENLENEYHRLLFTLPTVSNCRRPYSEAVAIVQALFDRENCEA